MKSILAANIPHYYYSAQALQSAGHLQRYICAVGVRGEATWLRWLPDYWRRKLRGRDISGIDRNLTTSLWLPELMQRGFPRLGVMSSERGNWLNNHLFDLAARRHVTACDVFHFVSSVGLYAARKARSVGAVVVCDGRTEYPDYQRRILAEENHHLGLKTAITGSLYDGKIKQEYALADYFILPSGYAKRTFVEAGFDEERIFVLPYGVDDEIFFRDGSVAPEPDSTFRIVYAGQIVPRKGIHYLVRAFQQLALPNTELLLLGRIDDAFYRYLRGVIKDDARIKLPGSVPKQELRKRFNAASVFILPSLSDSWGLVVAEAMACGLPVIVTENVGSKEMVRDGVDGFVIPMRSVTAIVEKLSLLYDNRALRRRMAEAACDQVRHFTWERYQQGLLAVYAEIERRERLSEKSDGRLSVGRSGVNG
ncbi:MAG: glycosyltransferase family 4 protein [Anaerolineales bacterium]|nr:glycosyltransferase family 4 protein [Anaerolineales bacterium]MCB8951263.1 glycosyltransferase family 4 protein [Ardenticatenales bacterium]